jgi:hypothetical protein
MTINQSLVEKLKCIPRWTPLQVADAQYSPDKLIAPNIYKVADGIYLSASPYSDAAFSKAPKGPFAVGILLAETDGAALRALTMAIERDEHLCSSPISVKPLLGSDLQTFEQIQSWLRACNASPPMESAVYRIASDGAFVCRKLETAQFCFFFRSNLDDSKEPPFAVLGRLPPPTSNPVN